MYVYAYLHIIYFDSFAMQLAAIHLWVYTYSDGGGGVDIVATTE